MRQIFRQWRTALGKVPIPHVAMDDYLAFRTQVAQRMAVPTLAVAAIVMSGVLAIDLLVIPDVAMLAVIVRLGIAAPLAVAVGLFLCGGERPLASIEAMFTGLALIFGTLACVVVAASHSPLASIYLTANNITIVFVLLLVHFRPRRAAAVAAAVIAIQAGAIMLSPFARWDVLALLTGISAMVAGVGLFGNIALDRAQRLRFLGKLRDQERMRALAARNAILERLSAIDCLTGLTNRRVFDAVLETTVAELDASGERTLALAMIDIDHFKPFNDTLGHQAGDDALCDVAEALVRAARPGDLVARYGGEEFAIVMPDTAAISLELIAARLRGAVEHLAIAHPRSETALHVTASIGIAHARHGTTPGALLAAADAALYEAKADGRNVAVIRSCDPTGVVRAAPPPALAAIR